MNFRFKGQMQGIEIIHMIHTRLKMALFTHMPFKILPWDHDKGFIAAATQKKFCVKFCPWYVWSSFTEYFKGNELLLDDQ